MRRRQFLALGLAGLLPGCGSDGSTPASPETDPPTVTPVPTLTPYPPETETPSPMPTVSVPSVEVSGSPTPTPTVPALAQHILSVRGSDDRTIDGVDLEDGLTIVDATHAGTNNFIVKAVNTQNDGIGALFVNAAGDFDGAAAALLTEGTYRLEIIADGEWTVDLRQPRSVTGETPPFALAENGPDVFGPFEFSEGTYTATGRLNGDQNFIVEVIAPRGDRSVIFNEIGAFEDTTTFQPPFIGFLEVTAYSEWTLEIK